MTLTCEIKIKKEQFNSVSDLNPNLMMGFFDRCQKYCKIKSTILTFIFFRSDVYAYFLCLKDKKMPTQPMLKFVKLDRDMPTKRIAGERKKDFHEIYS